MEKGLAKVVTIDSDSENELEILSESIPNYGNYSTPVEISPELQEKIRMSLENRASLPGKIKTIKVYATKRSSQVMGSVRASFRPSGGQPTNTINVGASINDLFSNLVRGGGNNNSKKSENVTALDSAKHVQTVQKRSQQPLPVGADQRVTERPSAPSSPVILYSPIRKVKTAKPKDILDRALPTLWFKSTVTHLPENTNPSSLPLVSWKKNISQSLDEENVDQESSKTEMKTNEEFQVKTNIPKVKYDLSLRDLDLNTSDTVLKNVCAKVNPVELSPIRFSSDDEQFVEDSILGIWNSPVPSPQNCVDPLLDLEQNSPFGKVNSKDCVDVTEDSKDLVVNEETLQNMPMHLVKEMWEKMNEDNISKQQYLYEKETIVMNEEESNLENLVNQDEQDYNGERESVLYNETEIITDVYNEEQCSNFGSEKQNSNDKFAMSKYVKINVETLPKRLLESSILKSENESFLNVSSDKDGSDPPLWSTKDGSDPPLWSTKDGSDPPLWSTKDGSDLPLWSTKDGSNPPLWSTKDGSDPPLWSTKDVSDPPLWSTKDVSDPPLWSTKDGSDPPLWSTIFPPSPPSPPPSSWMSSSALWELGASGFEAITGLCGHQTANDFKRKLNAPKPLVRVLRKRHKN